jgi:putative hydrolase of the HAD superfamily
MKYKNIIFDLGNVLLEWNPQRFLKQLELPVHFKEVFQSLLWATHDGGLLTREELVAKLPAQYDKKVFADCIGRIAPFLTPIPEMIEMLHEVRKGYKVYILSNMPKELHHELKQLHDFFNYFDGQVYSYEVKAIKPQPQIYQALLNNYNLKGHESVFIDDLEGNVRAAKELGIEGIVCKNPAQVRAELQSLKIITPPSSNTDGL